MYRHIKLKQKKLYRVLFILLIVGFFTRLDNSNLYGCIIGVFGVFELDNILYSGLSIVLVLLSYNFRNKRLGVVILIIELAYWSFKLMVIKGGYAVGIVGVPEKMVVIHDFIVLLLRLSLISVMLNKPLMMRWMVVISVITICMRIFNPAEPLYIFDESKLFIYDNILEPDSLFLQSCDDKPNIDSLFKVVTRE